VERSFRCVIIASVVVAVAIIGVCSGQAYKAYREYKEKEVK